MSEEKALSAGDLAELTSRIVAAYVSSNSINSGSLPELISSVHDSLTAIVAPPAAPEAVRPTPPVPVKKSITPDYLISLEDGQPYKSLKRHLTSRGLTPAEYRDKWGLPSDYPMVAPNYAKQRSELAKTMGLGRKREDEPAPAPQPKRARKAA